MFRCCCSSSSKASISIYVDEVSAVRIKVLTSFSGELFLIDSVSVVCFRFFSCCLSVVKGCCPLLPSPGPFRFFVIGFLADDAFKFFAVAGVFFAGLFCRASVGGANTSSGLDRVFISESSNCDLGSRKGIMRY